VLIHQRTGSENISDRNNNNSTKIGVAVQRESYKGVHLTTFKHDSVGDVIILLVGNCRKSDSGNSRRFLNAE